MTPEQNGNDVEIQQCAPQPVLSIRETIQVANLGEAMDDRLRTLRDYLHQQDILPVGPPVVRYHTFGETESDFEFSIPVVAPIGGEGRITAGELPGGPAVTTWHIGPHHNLGEAYARIQAWLDKHSNEPNGPAWEVYYWLDPAQYSGPSTLPDASSWRTQLIQLVK
jgi:effector-binding domain-containing protein